MALDTLLPVDDEREFGPGLMSVHAWREAHYEKISIEMIGLTYDDPDDVRPSDHDDIREIRSRWFGDLGVEVLVDRQDGRVVTVWRKGGRS